MNVLSKRNYFLISYNLTPVGLLLDAWGKVEEVKMIPDLSAAHIDVPGHRLDDLSVAHPGRPAPGCIHRAGKCVIGPASWAPHHPRSCG